MKFPPESPTPSLCTFNLRHLALGWGHTPLYTNSSAPRLMLNGGLYLLFLQLLVFVLSTDFRVSGLCSDGTFLKMFPPVGYCYSIL